MVLCSHINTLEVLDRRAAAVARVRGNNVRTGYRNGKAYIGPRLVVGGILAESGVAVKSAGGVTAAGGAADGNACSGPGVVILYAI